MKKKILYFVLSLIIISMPLCVSQASVLTGCNTGSLGSDGNYTNPCDFNALLTLVNNVINFLLFEIATPLVALIICYTGFLLLTTGGSAEKATKAKHIFTNVVVGYVIGLASWLIIKTIFSAVGFTGNTFLK